MLEQPKVARELRRGLRHAAQCVEHTTVYLPRIRLSRYSEGSVEAELCGDPPIELAHSIMIISEELQERSLRSSRSLTPAQPHRLDAPADFFYVQPKVLHPQRGA